MGPSENDQSTEVGCLLEQETSVGINKCPMTPEDKKEEDEEDEEEDIDFNPFLKETPSPEASSSLSSEIVGDSEHGEEEITTQATVSTSGACEEGKKCHKDVASKTKKRKSLLISQSETKSVPGKENGSESRAIDVNDHMVRDVSKSVHSLKPILDLGNEDAICRRTRARYSLASFTLDELEAFLQETDDEDDLQNADDEEAYRKFLAAVLQGGDGEDQSTQENENVDDEDEDNDADFEIELEEMLESDCEVGTANKIQKEEFVRSRRRPETRQNRRQKASVEYKKKLLEQSKRPLRPLLPILPNVQPVAPFSILDGKYLIPATERTSLSSTTQNTSTNGFSPHQIGQLYCLIHEHVQLLIQVFSLCILDPSRQSIASQVQGLIFEMLQKRDERIAVRTEPFPDIYFRSPYIFPSVPDALRQCGSEQTTFDSSSSFDAPCVSRPSNIDASTFQNTSTSEGSCEHVLNSQVGPVQAMQGSFWLPSISGPILSVLDVAPLNLVGKYVDDVYTAVHDHRQRCLASDSDSFFQREPLFPFPSFVSLAKRNYETSRGRILPAANTATSSPSPQPPKRSLAAALVESTKKKSVALVPKEISNLALRFAPLFNPSLFPHKPPPPSVANRLLFTDSEDELLALGMMEYNTDWKAIQQRFLPCKSKHQIFVRQKNRCSSKAPENPIKAVRRMKNSPLTAKEIECIQEGLKVFKLDWMSVWKFVVPHRDPTLLRRQWRIALGTQKSYKQDAYKKEKRRLYEFKRRCKTADLANWHLNSYKEVENAGGDANTADGHMENTEEVYVHEGFLADWRPRAYAQGLSGNSCVNHGEKYPTCGILLRQGCHLGGDPNSIGSVRTPLPTTNMNEHPNAANYFQNPYPSHLTHLRQDVSNTMHPSHPIPNMASKSSKSLVQLPPYRTRRNNNAHLVKLAPGLPPVNLPPSVRVIPQSTFKNVQCGSSLKISTTDNSSCHSGQGNAVTLIPHIAKSGSPCLMTTEGDKRRNTEDVTNCHLEGSLVVEEERGTHSELQMHPLLFQPPEDGCPSKDPLNFRSSTFSFFAGNQPQLNLSLFHNPRQLSHAVNSFNKSLKVKEPTSGSCVSDFHPLLKRAEDANNNSVTTPSNAHLSVGSERKSGQHKCPFDAVPSKSSVINGSLSASSVPSGRNEKCNELDLEIHLCSSSTKDGAVRNKDMTPQYPLVSKDTAHSGDKTETQHNSNSYHQYVESGSQAVSDGQLTSCIDDMVDHSHPEIVMEQEELSDSDEEIEEHVEFECEEMTDSEGEEGSGCEQIAEMQQDKEVPGLLTEKATDGDSDHHQHGLRSAHCQGSASSSGKGSSPLLKLGLTNLRKDTTSSSWLSLNSATLGHPTRAKSKNTEGTISEGTAAESMSSGLIRPCKKTASSTRRVPAQVLASDISQQLSLSSLAAQTTRQTGKRESRNNTGSNIKTTDDID